MSEEQVVVFRLENEEYCIPINQVREIIHYTGATKLPASPAYFDGIINLRGKIIPVFDLAVKFKLQAKTGPRKALIVELDETSLGIVVDEVSEVIRIQDSAIETAPPQTAIGGTYIRGIGKQNGRLLILLELRNLVDQEEAVKAAS